MPHRPDMILMRMGDEDRIKTVDPFRQPINVGEDQIHTRCAVHVGEGDPHVDQDEALFAGAPVAVNIHVHAHFARPAKGQVNQPLCCHQFCFLL